MQSSTTAIAGGALLAIGAGALAGRAGFDAVERRIAAGEQPTRARSNEHVQRSAAAFAGVALLLSIGIGARGAAADLVERAFMPVAIAGLGATIGSVAGVQLAGR